MFSLAIFLIFISYLIFFLGLVNLYSRSWLYSIWTIFIIGFILWFIREKTLSEQRPKFSRLEKGINILIYFFILINFLKLMIPEIAFDALWYHLTLPKLYLQEGGLKFFKGGLLYYSAMPQLAEMFYVLGLSIKGQFLARGFHFSFGILCLPAIFKLARKFLGKSLSLLVVLLFYSQFTVSWLSGSAYVDLTRTFFEIIALLAFFEWKENKKNHSLIKSGMLAGAAIGVKLLTASSAITLIILTLIYAKKKIRQSIAFLVGAFLTGAPWLIYGFLKTKTFLYPFLTPWFWQGQTAGLEVFAFLKTKNPVTLLQAIIRTTFTKGDILSPIYLISIPLFLKAKNLLNKKTKPLFLYFLINFFFWFSMPINFNRFLLPYTPAILILIVATIKNQSVFIKKVFIIASVLTAILNLGTRVMVLKKDLPLLLGKETWQEYLENNLEKSDFLDKDSFLEKNVTSNEKVLIVGGHNLFYVPVYFDHISWAEEGIKYKYLVAQTKELPEKWQNLKLVYQDKERKIKIYEFNRGI